MELLESQDPDKKRLIETSERHKRELEKEVRTISEKTERMLINALVIGGSLALTYFLLSQWTKSSGKKKHKGKPSENGEHESDADEGVQTPSIISQIGTKVINQATLILLDIAREKLVDYLESRKNRNENS